MEECTVPSQPASQHMQEQKGEKSLYIFVPRMNETTNKTKPSRGCACAGVLLADVLSYSFFFLFFVQRPAGVLVA